MNLRRYFVGGSVLALVAAIGVLARAEPTPTVMATADFTDVGELEIGAPVQMNDIPVGSVRDIALVRGGDRTFARVTFVVTSHVSALPETALARVRRTSILGEKVISLVPTPTDLGGAPLRNGAHLGEGAVTGDIEQLVESGGAVVLAVGAGNLGTIIDEGARGLAGQGPVLRQLVDDLAILAASYAEDHEQLEELVRSLDTLGVEVGSSAGEQAQLLTNLADLMQILEDERVQIIETATALTEASSVGAGVLQRQREGLDRLLSHVAQVIDLLAEEHETVGELLVQAPRHNATTTDVVRDGFLQLLIDITLCGVPEGGERVDDEARVCDNRFVERDPRERSE